MKKGDYEWLQLRAGRVQLQKAFDALGRAFKELSAVQPESSHLETIRLQMSELTVLLAECDANLNAS